MTKVGLGPSCAVFSLPVFGDIVACDTVGHSFATALPELEAKKGIIRCKNLIVTSSFPWLARSKKVLLPLQTKRKEGLFTVFKTTFVCWKHELLSTLKNFSMQAGLRNYTCCQLVIDNFFTYVSTAS